MDNLKQFTDDEIFHYGELVKAYYHDENHGSTSMHTHNFYELNIVMSGNGTHTVNNTTFHISTGDVFIMPPGIDHGYSLNSKNYSVFHLLFNKHFFEKYGAYLKKLTGYQILFNIDPLIRTQENATNGFLHINVAENYNLTRVFDELASLEHENKNNSEQQKEFLTLYVIAKICDMIFEEHVTYKSSKINLLYVLKSIEYIHTNFGKKIELETLYTLSSMSRSSYIRYFKQLFNCTPLDYIQTYRLSQAKYMLKYTDIPLASIANDCGFFDAAHFSRLFKEKYQLSPSNYRVLAKSGKKTDIKDTPKKS